MRKREIVWGIRQYGIFLPFLVRATRKQAIHDCRTDMRGYDEPIKTWTQQRRRGYTVHKLEVRHAR